MMGFYTERKKKTKQKNNSNLNKWQDRKYMNDEVGASLLRCSGGS